MCRHHVLLIKCRDGWVRVERGVGVGGVFTHPHPVYLYCLVMSAFVLFLPVV